MPTSCSNEYPSPIAHLFQNVISYYSLSRDFVKIGRTTFDLKKGCAKLFMTLLAYEQVSLSAE